MSQPTFRWIRQDLDFKIPAKTSRNTLMQKPSWFLILEDDEGRIGLGECSTIPTLSIDSEEEIEQTLQSYNKRFSLAEFDSTSLKHLPALRFGMECCVRSYKAEDPYKLYPSDFTNGQQDIPMNGLIWMDDHEGLFAQIERLVAEGFSILKMKIGARDHELELDFLRKFRERYPASDFELRVDANGAYTPENALSKLNDLAPFEIHSIEQPIKAGQHEAMADLCAATPIPIGLDEELINCDDIDALLDMIKPQYLILKPSLIGGLGVADSFVASAESRGIKWWATSALESNVGLNAIAQWCAVSGNPLPQGLGTGRLFHNNIDSPLEVKNAALHYGDASWKFDF